jgi:hypothetical protein
MPLPADTLRTVGYLTEEHLDRQTMVINRTFFTTTGASPINWLGPTSTLARNTATELPYASQKWPRHIPIPTPIPGPNLLPSLSVLPLPCSLSSRTQDHTKSGEPLSSCPDFLRRSAIHRLPHQIPAWSGRFTHLHPAMDAPARGTAARRDTWHGRINLLWGVGCGSRRPPPATLQLALWFRTPGCFAGRATRESADAFCLLRVAGPFAHAGVVRLFLSDVLLRWRTGWGGTRIDGLGE